MPGRGAREKLKHGSWQYYRYVGCGLQVKAGIPCGGRSRDTLAAVRDAPPPPPPTPRHATHTHTHTNHSPFLCKVLTQAWLPPVAAHVSILVICGPAGEQALKARKRSREGGRALAVTAVEAQQEVVVHFRKGQSHASPVRIWTMFGLRF